MSDTTYDANDDAGEVLAPLSPDVSPAIAAEINQQVATAHRFPRPPIKKISDEIMSWATLSEETASECMYTLKRGDKPITGPSIRFAEIVRAAYGNIRVAARFVRLDLDDAKRGAVIVEAVALDLERNQAEVIPVRRSVMTSGRGPGGPKVYSADMINMTVNAASSLARRNAILAVVPKSFWIAAYQRVVQVLQGDAKTLGTRRAEVLAAFGRIGVKPEVVFAALGVKTIEDITIEHMPQLIGFMTAIRDGETPDTVFARVVVEGSAPQPAHATVKNPLKDEPVDGAGLKASTAATIDAEAQGPENIDPASGELQKAVSNNGAAEVVEKNDTAAPAMAREPAQTETVKPAAKAAGNGGAVTPSNEAEYRVHTMAWIAAATEGAAARTKWSSERELRKACKLSEGVLVECSQALDAKVRELAGAQA